MLGLSGWLGGVDFVGVAADSDVPGPAPIELISLRAGIYWWVLFADAVPHARGSPHAHRERRPVTITVPVMVVSRDEW